ncbi:MAG TPA: hypothetical protein PKL29_09530, partial [Methanothrix sp.]|nr:hypothetical protein [Methanothrix sp.]
MGTKSGAKNTPCHPIYSGSWPFCLAGPGNEYCGNTWNLLHHPKNSFDAGNHKSLSAMAVLQVIEIG